MISSKTLIKLARKWQKLATPKRKHVSFSKASDEEPCCSSSKGEKGHFVIYSTDGKRFLIPLAYLTSDIFVQLLDMALEEFGVQGDGCITLPWDGNFIEYARSLVQRRVGEDLQQAFLMSMTRSHCLISSHLLGDQTRYQTFICSF